jgi:predicted MPP superfamily phosphohydrolase
VKRLPVFLAALALVLAACVFIAWRDTTTPVLREVVVPVPGLQHEVTMLQVSDLQGCEYGERQSRLSELLHGRRFDAIVLTGDMLDWPKQPRDAVYQLADVLRPLSPRLYYLRGNHDPLDLGTALASRGVTPLAVGRVFPLADGDPRGAQAALVYGVNSGAIGAARGSGKRLLVVASHTPPDPGRLAAGASAGPGTHLFIAGHTHAGQIRLPLVGAVWAPMSWYAEEGGRGSDNEITFLPELKGRLVDGMYDRDGQRVFVSRGVGTTGFMVLGRRITVRFLCRAEMVAFRLVPAR